MQSVRKTENETKFFILYKISDQFADFEIPLDGINLVKFF